MTRNNCYLFLMFFLLCSFLSISSLYLIYLHPYIYIFFRKVFYYYSSWQCGNGGNGFFKSFIILVICFRISVEIRKRVAIVAMLPSDENQELILQWRKTRRIKNKQQNQLIKQRQGSLNGIIYDQMCCFIVFMIKICFRIFFDN